jgi:hypothetical protein
MRRFPIWARATLLLCLGISVCINVVLVRDGTALSRTLSEKGTVIMSPSLTEMLLSDLKSADKVRLQQWRSYLYRAGGYGTNIVVPGGGLDATFAMYKSREKPGRSNYYNQLVFEVERKQKATRLSRQALLGFLGPPDAVAEHRAGQILGYNYWCDGIEFLVTAVVSNETVVNMQIGLKPSDSPVVP